MFPLTAKSVMTFEFYKRFSWALTLRSKQFYLYIALIVLFSVAYAIPQLLYGDQASGVASLIFMGVLLLTLFLSFQLRISRTYKKNPVIQDEEQDYLFYENHVLIKSKRGEMTDQYSEITKVIVTNKDFYIMLGRNMGLPLQKVDCSPELQRFIMDLKTTHLKQGHRYEEFIFELLFFIFKNIEIYTKNNDYF